MNAVANLVGHLVVFGSRRSQIHGHARSWCADQRLSFTEPPIAQAGTDPTRMPMPWELWSHQL